MIRAGQLDQRVVLQSKTTSRASNGEEVVTWGPHAVVWAKVQQLRGKEYFAGGQMQDVVDVKVLIRYRDDVTRDMRVMWKGQPLDIVSVIAVEGRQGGLELMCLSGARNGNG